MDGQQLQSVADGYARGLRGVEVENAADPTWDRYKVSGKVFMLMTDMPGRPVVILKADPSDAVHLKQYYHEITPGYHMNKSHWITLEGGGGIDATMVEELVAESYRLVVQGLPGTRRRALEDGTS